MNPGTAEVPFFEGTCEVVRIGRIETLCRVYQLGKLMHPERTLRAMKHRVLLLLRAMRFFPLVSRWYGIADNPLLTRALARFPTMHGAMYWPYINHSWPMARKLAAIDRHFRMLDQRAAVIARATFEEVEMACLDEAYPGLRVVLDKAIWFLREGEIVLNLFIGEQRFYSIAFTLGCDGAHPVAYVGALQGSNVDEAQDVYRDLTRALHGMRPRDLLMTALKLLCCEIGITRIWAVSGDMRQHNSPYFGNSHKDKVLVAYDEVWTEHGGVALDNGFYEIATEVRRRDMDEIPSRKRAAYRRRYDMLDRLAADIRTACLRHNDE